tara:strand:- start:324 stop:728 length:405 start_codon:yes stop_codon:yes gene_type:complete
VTWKKWKNSLSEFANKERGMYEQLAIGVAFYTVMHIAVWFGTNLQFIDGWKDKSFLIAIALSIPITCMAYMGTKFTYHALSDSAWSSRFIGFGTSWLVFPILTWVFLHESMLTPKTLICIALSFIIIGVQVWMP